MSKKTKWRTDLPEGLRVPFPLQWGRFLLRGDGSFQVVWRTNLGGRFGTTTKLWPGVTGRICARNGYLNTVFDDVVSLQKKCPPTVPAEKALTCCNSLSACEKAFLTRKEYAIYRSSRQIETCSLG